MITRKPIESQPNINEQSFGLRRHSLPTAIDLDSNSNRSRTASHLASTTNSPAISGKSSSLPNGSALSRQLPPIVVEEARSSPNIVVEPTDANQVSRMSPSIGSVNSERHSYITFKNRNSMQSDLKKDDSEAEASRYTEAVRQKRLLRKKRREEMDDEDNVVMGTRVAEGHENWVVAYNMLTGIRVAVSRTVAKVGRQLTPQDFEARHKFSFDVQGNELTPSAKYDFKFKDYAPWVFRSIREIFSVDAADYLVSLTGRYVLSEMGTPGKSGSFFYFSRDYRFIIKTIHHSEHKFLRKILKQYYEHVKSNPDTLISQFYGLHRVKQPFGRKIHFVVMNNLFPAHRDVHQTYDLKGSSIGRDYNEDSLESNPRATLKDLNWIRRKMHLNLGPKKRNAFMKVVRSDVEFMSRLNIMDYSLLIGIHDIRRGNKEKVRDATLSVFNPNQSQGGTDPQRLRNGSITPGDLKRMISHTSPKPIEQNGTLFLDSENTDNRDHAFYREGGGFRATDENDKPGNQIYYVGIIDLLTKYTTVKKIEHFWKGLSYPKSQISAAPPAEYSSRFLNFIDSSVYTSQKLLEGPKDQHSPEKGKGRGSSGDKVLAKAEKEAVKQEKRSGVSEEQRPSIVRSPQARPIKGELGPSSSDGPAIVPVAAEEPQDSNADTKSSAGESFPDKKDGVSLRADSSESDMGELETFYPSESTETTERKTAEMGDDSNGTLTSQILDDKMRSSPDHLDRDSRIDVALS